MPVTARRSWISRSSSSSVSSGSSHSSGIPSDARTQAGRDWRTTISCARAFASAADARRVARLTPNVPSSAMLAASRACTSGCGFAAPYRTRTSLASPSSPFDHVSPSGRSHATSSATGSAARRCCASAYSTAPSVDLPYETRAVERGVGRDRQRRLRVDVARQDGQRTRVGANRIGRHASSGYGAVDSRTRRARPDRACRR